MIDPSDNIVLRLVRLWAGAFWDVCKVCLMLALGVNFMLLPLWGAALLQWRWAGPQPALLCGGGMATLLWEISWFVAFDRARAALPVEELR